MAEKTQLQDEVKQRLDVVKKDPVALALVQLYAKINQKDQQREKELKNKAIYADRRKERWNWL